MKAVWTWVKTHWKGILEVVLGALAIVGLVGVAKRIVGSLGPALLTSQRQMKQGDKAWFTLLPGEEKKIAVKTPEGWKTADLPPGVQAMDVTAAVLLEGRVTVATDNPSFDDI